MKTAMNIKKEEDAEVRVKGGRRKSLISFPLTQIPAPLLRRPQSVPAKTFKDDMKTTFKKKVVKTRKIMSQQYLKSMMNTHEKY